MAGRESNCMGRTVGQKNALKPIPETTESCEGLTSGGSVVVRRAEVCEA